MSAIQIVTLSAEHRVNYQQGEPHPEVVLLFGSEVVAIWPAPDSMTYADEFTRQGRIEEFVAHKLSLLFDPVESSGSSSGGTS
jgi:hypothetical protein